MFIKVFLSILLSTNMMTEAWSQNFESKECDAQINAFEVAVKKLPIDCEQDTDCKLFYIHPNICEPPLVLNKKAETQITENKFKTLQSKVRESCAQKFSRMPVCEPQVYKFHCESQRCVEQSPHSALAYATLKQACAPHDAGSVMLELTNGKSEYPLLVVNWWSKGHPTFAGGEFTLKMNENVDAYAQGFQGSYCTKRGSCQSVNQLMLKFNLKANSLNGTLNFSFRTSDKKTFQGQATVKHVSTGMVPCG